MIVIAALVVGAPARPRARLAGVPVPACSCRTCCRSRSSASSSATCSSSTAWSTARSTPSGWAALDAGLAGLLRPGASTTIMFVIVWKELGFGIIVFLARLSSVGEELYEAARVDGAGWWSVFRHVTLPALVPAIVFFAVVETITMLSWVFAYMYVMTTGGPGNSTVVTRVLHLPEGLLQQQHRHRRGGRSVAAGARGGPDRDAAVGAAALRRGGHVSRPRPARAGGRAASALRPPPGAADARRAWRCCPSTSWSSTPSRPTAST